MHLICTLCPLAQSAGSVPVAIFSMGEERKLLFVPESFQETLGLVAESFDLGGDVVLSLRTSTINVLQGKEVEITQSAFAYARPCLGEVKVTIVERGQADQGRRHQKRAQEKSRAITPVRPEYPSSSVKDGDDFEPEDLPIASSTVIHPEDEQPLGSPIPDGVAIGGSSKAADTMEGKADHSQNSGKHADDERNIDQLEIPQETVVPPKAVNLQPIVELQDKGEGGSNSSKKFKPAGGSLSKSHREIGSPVRLKKEIIAGPATEEPVKPAPPSQPEEDPRFEITIIGPRNETAQFKTRGKHPVRKVLAAACKTFDVQYERARLILSVSTVEGGEIQTDQFDCPADETMSQCGVDANAKLFVRVESDPDDEEYEEDY